MANLANCPTEAELRELLLGNGVESVGEHLLDCPNCGANAGRLVASDPLLAELRAAHDTSEIGTDGTFVEELLRRIKQPSSAKTLPDAELAFLDPATAEFPTDLGMFNHYRIVEKIGEGGMGMVFRAVDSNLQRTVALKIILPKYAANQKLRDRFIEEARATVKVRSPHVAEVYETNVWKDVPYLTMELLVGTTLDKKPRPMAADALRRIGFSIAKGLADAHRSGMIHRDLKPSNIHLGTDARTGKPTVKLIDFGLARPVNRDIEITKSGELLGTPAYMSPEQARGRKVDHRTDLYSLGVILHQLATGKLPYDSAGEGVMAILTELATPEPLTSVAQRTEALPPSLAKLIDRLLAKDPANRPASADEVMKVLRESLNEKVDPNASGTAAAESAPYVSIPDSTGPYEASIAFSEMKTEPDAPDPKARRRWLWPALGVGVAVAALLIAIVLGAFKVKTKDGTIEIADLPADAEVVVDGNVVTLTWDAGKTKATATIPAGQHMIEVKASGITTTGERVTLAAGERKPITFQFRKPDQPTPTTLVKAEQPPYGKELIRNGGCDDAALSHWTRVSGGWYQNHHDRGPTFCAGDCAYGVLQQEVDVSAFAKDIDSGEVGFGFHVLFNTYDADTTRCVVQYLDAKGKILGDGYDTGERAHRWVWVPYSGMVIAPAGTRTVLVVLQSRRSKRPGNKQNSGYYDDVSLWAVHVPKGTETVPLYKSKEKADYTNALGMKFVRVPAGTAWLDGYSGKPGEREVTFANDFYLGMYEVTQAEWQKVMGSNSSHFSRNGKGAAAVKDESDATIGQLPVESITANDAAMFLAKLNELTKESGWVYRLPTGDEWEYACRGGPIPKSESGFDFYAGRPGYSMGAALANFDLANKRTLPVGSYPPNRLGLFDMHGNVWEMLNRPTDVNGKPVQISRGGCWDNVAAHCRAAHSMTYDPTPDNFAFGLRVVRVPFGTPTVGRLFADSNGAPVQFFGVGFKSSASLLDRFAPSSNLLFASGLPDAQPFIDAARTAKRPLVLAFGGKTRNEVEGKLFPIVEKNRDVVAGICWSLPYGNGYQPADVAALGTAIKNRFPGLNYSVSFADRPADPRTPTAIPPEVDLVVVNLYGDNTPEKVRTKTDLVLPDWIARANGRPLIVRWAAWEVDMGLVPRTDAGTFRACVDAAKKHKVAGVAFEPIDDDPRGFKGIASNPVLAKEIEDLGRELGFAAAAAAASPLDRNRFNIRKGRWSIVGDELAQTDTGEPYAAIEFGDESWTDYDYKVDVKRVQGKDQIALLYRWMQPSSFGLFGIGTAGNTFGVVEWQQAGKTGFLQRFDNRLPNDEWQTLIVKVRGDRITCQLNPGTKSALSWDAVNDRQPSGKVGLRVGYSHARFRNIKVTAPDGTVLWEGLPNLDGTQTSAVPPFINALGMKFARVPKGTVPLGGRDGKAGTVTATIAEDFYLGTYEVTQEEWQAVMGTTPPLIVRPSTVAQDTSAEAQKRFPVNSVTWFECREFVKKLNERLKEPGWEYCLPTEKEWEYACRGGPSADPSVFGFSYYAGTPSNELTSSQANFGDLLKNPCKVGSYAPNRLGLYDMHGNVSEWCDDEPNPPERDANGKEARINRGGSHWENADYNRSTWRSRWTPNERHRHVGLRIARVPVAQAFPTNSIGMAFAPIAPGKFLMGSPKSEQAEASKEKGGDFAKWETQHEVELTKGFELGRFPVTQGQYRAVTGLNPSHFRGDDLPVESVTWREAKEFCRLLSEKEGRTYRLPTEAEWEYACRAGTTTAFSFGAALTTDQANFDGRSLFGNGQYRGTTTPAGTFPANAWGLYDMHGNVWEWCEDRWKENEYARGNVRDPQGPSTGDRRNLRGGAWNDGTRRGTRSANRGFQLETFRDNATGFRIVRDLAVPVAAVAAPAEQKLTTLFNGKDLTGWSVENGNATQWSVVDGTIAGEVPPNGSSNWILTDRDYADFRLHCEFFLADDKASGAVGLRGIVGEKTKWGNEWLSEHPCLALNSGKVTFPKGAAWYLANSSRFIGASPEPNLPPGQWHACEIMVQRDRCVAKFNGQTCVDIKYDPKGPFSQNFTPGLSRDKGRVGLRIVGGKVQYRNIAIEELKAPASVDPAPPAAAKPVPLFNGKDLTGWEAVGNANATWKVEAGELVGGWKNSDFVGGSTLATTKKDYRHFRLKVVAKPSENWASRIVVLPGPNPTGTGGYFKVWIGTEKGEIGGEMGRLTLRATDDAPLLAKATVAANAWTTIEVEVRGNRVQVFVDGVKTADQTDDRLPAAGHSIGLHLTGGATLKIKSVEIEELKEPAPAEPKFTSLFNGKDIADWKRFGNPKGVWTVENGILKGSSPLSNYWGGAELYRDDIKYRQFHLRLEAQPSAGNPSRVYLFGNPSPGKGNADHDVWLGPGNKPMNHELGRLWYPLAKNPNAHAPLANPPPAVKAGEWYTMDIQYVGRRLTVDVNGVRVTDEKDLTVGPAKAVPFILDAADGGSIAFRTIEIRELK